MSEDKDEQYSSSSNDMMHISEMTTEEQINTLQDKLKRISKYLREIQMLSPKCEELVQEEMRDRQVFSRRVLQVCAELQDARDVLQKLCCPPRLTKRQFDLVTSESALGDPALDPSVRFFGIDWEQLFAKSFAISLNFQIIRAQVENLSAEIDLVLLNSLFKDLTTLEIDISAHGEAVLNGRLSKSQQKLIQQEQTKFSGLTPNNSQKISKSRSFRDTNGQKKQQRQMVKYKKNKTTDLNKLSTSASMSHFNSSSTNLGTAPVSTVVSQQNQHQQPKISLSRSSEWARQTAESPSSTSTQNQRSSDGSIKRKSSFIQNVSSMFKNMR